MITDGRTQGLASTNDEQDTELAPARTAPEQVEAWSLDETDEVHPMRRRGRLVTAGLVALVVGIVGTVIWLAATFFGWPSSKHVEPSRVPTAAPLVAAPPTPSHNDFAPSAPVSSGTAAPTPSAFIDPNAPTQANDNLYFTLLRMKGIYAQSNNDALFTAHLVCIRRQQGQPKHHIASEIANANGIGQNIANSIVTDAIGVYCPQYGGQ
jgi:hypothetical protein